MIPPPPTTMQLSTDDMSEYENVKKTWTKLKPETTTKKNETQEHRKEVRDRIGFGKKN